MADKEERFVIVKVSNYCGKCEALGSVECKNNPINKSGRACKVGMTRAEAVEIMAKAIYFKACGTMKDYDKCKKEYIPFAAAALDALLGYK